MEAEQLKARWMHNGAPLTMEKELIAIRTEIEREDYPKKQRRVLLKAAYNEMRNRQGKVSRTMDCGECTTQMLSQLKMWFSLYDKRSELQKDRAASDIAKNLAEMKAKGAKFRFLPDDSMPQQSILPKKLPPLMPVHKESNLPSKNKEEKLIPVDGRRQMFEQMEWNDILALMKTLPQEAQNKLNKEKTRNFPKKSAIIDELLLIK
jgi:hypothetical protein